MANIQNISNDQQDDAALAVFHGWRLEGGEWVHPDRPSDGYQDASEVVEDWSLWQSPEVVTSPSLPA